MLTKNDLSTMFQIGLLVALAMGCMFFNIFVILEIGGIVPVVCGIANVLNVIFLACFFDEVWSQE